MVLQLAPTLYHQAQSMLKFMMTFNWTHFTVVSTTEDNNFDFTAALRTLVKRIMTSTFSAGSSGSDSYDDDDVFGKKSTTYRE